MAPPKASPKTKPSLIGFLAKAPIGRVVFIIGAIVIVAFNLSDISNRDSGDILFERWIPSSQAEHLARFLLSHEAWGRIATRGDHDYASVFAFDIVAYLVTIGAVGCALVWEFWKNGQKISEGVMRVVKSSKVDDPGTIIIGLFVFVAAWFVAVLAEFNGGSGSQFHLLSRGPGYVAYTLIFAYSLALPCNLLLMLLTYFHIARHPEPYAE